MTRTSLQMIAEHLLSADLHAHTGRIGLRRTPGGFGQPEFTVDGERRRLRVDQTSLALLEGDTERWTPLTTIGELAEFAGVEPGAPETVFTPSTARSPDQPLEVDPAATEDLALFFATVEEALEALRSANPGHTPAMVQLWPEHFDLATNMSEVNFGGSPGDGAIDEPYLYVGPWSPLEGDFWNESFGAARRFAGIDGVRGALEFFSEGMERAMAARRVAP